MWLCTNTTLWLGKSCRKWSDSLHLHSLSARKDEAKTVGETSAVKVTPESRSNHWFCTSVSTFIGNLKNWRLIIEGSHELWASTEVRSFTECLGSLESAMDELHSYADFTVRHYVSSAVVVFDGYEEGPSIKYITHQRRRHTIHPLVSFTAESLKHSSMTRRRSSCQQIAINRGW